MSLASGADVATEEIAEKVSEVNISETKSEEVNILETENDEAPPAATEASNGEVVVEIPKEEVVIVPDATEENGEDSEDIDLDDIMDELDEDEG